MAESIGGGAPGQLPAKVEASAIPNLSCARVTRRQWTLIAITGLLNVLFVCSVLCIIVQIYEIVSDPDDSTNVASEILTFISALATLAYVVLHSIFSLKQRIWRHQGQLPAKDKKTSYIAVRCGGTLCMLWLLTSGWNMIIVARRPRCLPGALGLTSWEIGTTCRVGRVGVAFAMIALLASCALFGMLATVRRPFEAHLLNYKHTPHAPTPTITPTISPRQSRSRSTSVASTRFSRRGVSFSTHRSTHSNVSNADVDTIDLNSTAASDGIAAPAPIRSLGTGIFTSHVHPPPVPAAYATPSHNPLVGLPPPIFQPSLSTPNLPLPPRMSALVSSSGFVPLSIPAQYAPSNWRAVHPAAPSPLAVAASRSQSNLPSTDPSQRFSYRARHARSSISLTRPHRLSTSTPAHSVGWSSRSGSTSPRDSHDGNERRAAAGQIAFAILNGTRIPGTDFARAAGRHARHKSAPDASASAGAQVLRKKVQVIPGQGKTLVKSSSATLLGVHESGPPAPVQKDTAVKPSTGIAPPQRKLHSERPSAVLPKSKQPPPPPPPLRSPPPANVPAVPMPLMVTAPRQVQRPPPAALTKRLSADPSIAALLGPASWEKENVEVGLGLDFDFQMVKNKPLPKIMGVGEDVKAKQSGQGVYYR
ncbi:uncharacterized protein CC84DRAFT_793057 [Paraphaeosphaeria sporulosa]|uniref:Uncharacterized protein n=1 Tax=Paraphaeosphaeria sporulosa TaxID=1460663 RepID=A0A177CA36_9PLEO|nr:uncharacterized protein CC84DRAFT_793057 [Paraphaeosphaeria sporulosa]OAG04445.1 hypothetical protein CC84DRAFT_793057 [Paraphaeosphaeria sporulosa]